MPPQNTVELSTQQELAEKSNQKQENGANNNKAATEEEFPTTTVIVPPDGGWGWVVMVASLLSNTLVDGIVFSAGMFIVPICKEFNAGEAEVALASSLLSGFYLLAGPFVSALANRWGFRLVTIIGALISATAFAVSRYATSVAFLYVSYGLCGGIGFCLIYMPSVLTVGYYFERWRALATGIALSGSGIGTFIFAPLSTYLIEQFGWRDALFYQSGMILLCIVCALCYRPLQPIQVTLKEDGAPDEKNTLLGPDALPVVFTKPLPEGRQAFSVPTSSHSTWMGTPSNTQYPTAAEVFRGSYTNLDRRPSNQSGVLSSSNIVSTNKKLEQWSKVQQRLSGQMTPEHTIHAHTHIPPSDLVTVGEADDENEENESGTLIAPSKTPTIVQITTPSATPAVTVSAVNGAVNGERRHTVSGRHSKPGSRRGSQHNINRPLYRDDILYTGSLVRIPQYQSQTSLAYHMSVTRLPAKADVDEEEEQPCKICPEAVRRTLATMLDVSLLKSPAFMLLALSGFFTMAGFFVPFMFIKQRAIEAGMDEQPALLIVSVIGISNTIARIICGLLSSFKGVNALHINNVAITIGGIATIFSGMYVTAAVQYSYAVIFGIAIACFSALRSILVVELMGLDKLTNAFGIIMLFQGVAACIGAPIAGSFKDLTGSYDSTFYLSGTLITISAVLCYPLKMVKTWEDKRAEAKKTNSA